MFKRCSALLLCLAALLGMTACGGGQPDSGAESAGKLKVSVTFNAIKEFAAAVGGDKVEVSAIIPDGMEAHDFEPKAQDLVSLGEAQVFIRNGLGMESWAEDAVRAVDNPNLIVVDASEGAELIEKAQTDEHEEEHADEDGQYDPHLWLSLKGAQTEARNIRDAFIQADPANKNDYTANCDAFTQALETLYGEYTQKFSAATQKTFVTGHAAFGYLCRDFGLTQNSVSDVFAEGEPSAQQLAALVEYCRERHVTTIFAEELASPEVSQTLADEVGAKVETIYTMESAEDGKTYLERMEDNLRKIADSLSV
ncbi:MAG: metal ABC transporter substrate-binding protein [Intestinibacillus sp.]